MRTSPITYRHSGTTLIEVLVTIVILAFGLLGLAGLQSRLQLEQMEAYQRAQALLLMEDMANRIAANRNNALNYIISPTTPTGTGTACPVLSATPTRQQIDTREWCLGLQGAAEFNASGTRLGAMVGGRGCVENLGGGNYMVTVAWQGIKPISAPPESVACGKTGNPYNSAAGTDCNNDLCRRTVTTIVSIASMS